VSIIIDVKSDERKRQQRRQQKGCARVFVFGDMEPTTIETNDFSFYIQQSNIGLMMMKTMMMKLYPSQLLHSMNTYYFYYSYYVIRQQQQQIGCHVLYATDDRDPFTFLELESLQYKNTKTV